MKKDLKGLDIHLSAAIQLHGLLAWETFTCPTTDEQHTNIFSPNIQYSLEGSKQQVLQ